MVKVKAGCLLVINCSTAVSCRPWRDTPLFQRPVPGMLLWCPDTGWRPETRCGPPAAAPAPGQTRTPPSAQTRPRAPPVLSSDTRRTSQTRKRRHLYASVKTTAVTMTRGKTKIKTSIVILSMVEQLSFSPLTYVLCPVNILSSAVTWLTWVTRSPPLSPGAWSGGTPGPAPHSGEPRPALTVSCRPRGGDHSGESSHLCLYYPRDVY